MSPETIHPPQNPEAPRTQSRRALIKDIGKFTAQSVLIGSVIGVVGTEGSREIATRLEEREYEKSLDELEELLEYVDNLCDGGIEQIPWYDPDTNNLFPLESSPQSYSEYNAEKAGLHLVDTEEALYAIDNAQTIEEVLEGFEVFTRQFGAEVTLADNWQFPKVTDEEREKQYGGYSNVGVLKYRFSEMIKALNAVPKELFELSNISAIHFTEFTTPTIALENGDKALPSATVTLDGQGKMNMSLDNVFAGTANEYTLCHEVGHLLDEQMSKSVSEAKKDPFFDGFNESDFEYQGVIPDKLEHDGFVREYSAYTILEDKAVLFENMLSGVDFNLARSDDLILRKKYRVQLARLEQHIPNIAPYLITQGYNGMISPRNNYGAYDSVSAPTFA